MNEWRVGGVRGPRDRYKHACCIRGNCVYLYGGRDTNMQKDFWRYNVLLNEWSELDTNTEEAPKELEEHTMVESEGVLYIFGGMLDSAYNEVTTPLWMYHIDKERWSRWRGAAGGVQSPCNRKGHSAVVYRSAMHVYGGYIDMRGSSQDFWTFTFENTEWSLQTSSCESGPGPRHSHAAVTYQDGMYLYGGLMGLNEQSDFWKWDFSSLAWSRIRVLSGPSKLFGHTVVTYKDAMLLFGGGETQNGGKSPFWKFQFLAETWQRLDGSPLQPKSYHSCLGWGVSFTPCGDHFSASQNSKPEAQSRSFKKRSADPQDNGIEMQTFKMQSKAEEQETHGIGQKSRSTEDVSPQCSTAHTNSEGQSTEDPQDLLLVIGGKPLSGGTAISVWKILLDKV
ncbi:leucine-zipper-like transcriptional regulator 1 homolog [Erpetoichthys calabaricus]|uniref:leucine-zipper-like transcriptional regulator 1 homolog n=1 Tax=Erpetoichthys calabaricus TaxID=27687 RepID=UPI00109F3F05|nr:leucine-zipper-like transcriptional regulator 1 homolog [Erpetoichthys calabaricus]